MAKKRKYKRKLFSKKNKKRIYIGAGVITLFLLILFSFGVLNNVIPILMHDVNCGYETDTILGCSLNKNDISLGIGGTSSISRIGIAPISIRVKQFPVGEGFPVQMKGNYNTYLGSGVYNASAEFVVNGNCTLGTTSWGASEGRCVFSPEDIVFSVPLESIRGASPGQDTFTISSFRVYLEGETPAITIIPVVVEDPVVEEPESEEPVVEEPESEDPVVEEPEVIVIEEEVVSTNIFVDEVTQTTQNTKTGEVLVKDPVTRLSTISWMLIGFGFTFIILVSILIMRRKKKRR